MTKEILQSKLKKAIEMGVLTPARHIDEATFVVMDEYLPTGQVTYHQFPYDQMPEDWKIGLAKRKAGEFVGRIHILGVFDIWD